MFTNEILLARLAADRQIELRRLAAEIKIDRLVRYATRSRVRAWLGLRLAHAGARLAGIHVELPRTVRELERISCAEC